MSLCYLNYSKLRKFKYKLINVVDGKKMFAFSNLPYACHFLCDHKSSHQEMKLISLLFHSRLALCFSLVNRILRNDNMLVPSLGLKNLHTYLLSIETTIEQAELVCEKISTGGPAMICPAKKILESSTHNQNISS